MGRYSQRLIRYQGNYWLLLVAPRRQMKAPDSNREQGPASRYSEFVWKSLSLLRVLTFGLYFGKLSSLLITCEDQAVYFTLVFLCVK